MKKFSCVQLWAAGVASRLMDNPNYPLYNYLWHMGSSFIRRQIQHESSTITTGPLNFLILILCSLTFICILTAELITCNVSHPESKLALSYPHVNYDSEECQEHKWHQSGTKGFSSTLIAFR